MMEARSFPLRSLNMSKFRFVCLLAAMMLAGNLARSQATPTEGDLHLDSAIDDAQNILSAWSQGEGHESAALPLMTLLRGSHELICSSWKINGYVLLRNMAINDSDPAAQEALWKLNARIEAACAEEHFTAGPPGPGTVPVAPGTTTPTPPPPPPPPKTPEEMADAICANQCRGAYDAWMAALEAQTNAGMNYFGSHAAADLADYQAAIKSSGMAKAAYYACLERCYSGAVGAKAITEVPAWVRKVTHPTPAPPPVPAPSSVKTVVPKLEEGSNFKSVAPSPGSAALKNEGAYLPSIAGPGSTIVATVTDSTGAGQQEFIVGTVDDSGGRKYFKGKTGEAGKVVFAVGAGVAAVELFTHFDEQGNPSQPAQMNIGENAHLPDSEPLPKAQIPSHGPAITEGYSVIDRGGASNGAITLHTTGTNPLTTRVLVDNQEIKTLAASDSSVTARLPEETPLGSHQISVSSDGVKSNAFTADVVTVQSEPISPMHSGSKTAVVVHVDGVPAGHQAVMHFEVSGAAKLKSGAAGEDVPIKNGIAKVEIQGVHAGALTVKYQMSIPKLWTGKAAAAAQE